MTKETDLDPAEIQSSKWLSGIRSDVLLWLETETSDAADFIVVCDNLSHLSVKTIRFHRKKKFIGDGQWIWSAAEEGNPYELTGQLIAIYGTRLHTD